MSDFRPQSRVPAAAGPSMLTVLAGVALVTYFLRMLAPPVPPGYAPPGALSLDALKQGEWWTVLTSIFTHDSLWHLLSNVLLLVLAGRPVQRRAGPGHLAGIFFVSAWAGALFFLLSNAEQAVVGASGGVMGVIGAFTAIHGETDVMRPFRRFVALPLRARRLFPALLVSFVIMELTARSVSGIPWEGFYREAHLVHAGGLLAGWFYGRRLAVALRVREAWEHFTPRPVSTRTPGAAGTPVPAGFPLQKNAVTTEPSLPPPARDLNDREFLQDRVDPVLEKLYAEGANALTAEEQAILEEASRRFSRLPP